jgi:hypothetical protein
MKPSLLLLFIPTLLLAQDFEFQFEPEAFPVEINGWQPFSPWAGEKVRRHPIFAILTWTMI